MKNNKSNRLSKFIIFFLFLFIIIFVYNFIYNNIYMGDYIIQKQWIGSDYNNRTYCDNCLWIEFFEGCNRYETYFFKNQHELDKRFNIGDAVNINLKNGYVQGVNNAFKYRTKCSYSVDFVYYFFLYLIMIIYSALYIMILLKEKSK